MNKCRLFVSAFVLIAVILVMSFSIAFAHPGSLDENGGHYNRATGEYHFHHGYPAHQHTNGICPYDFDDKTNTDYDGNNGNSTTQVIRSPVASPKRTSIPVKTSTPKPSPTFITSTEGGGDYYFHDGYPGHQHINGYCPYDSSIVPAATPSPTASSGRVTAAGTLALWIFGTVFGSAIMLFLLAALWEWLKSLKERHKSKRQNQLIYSNRKMSDFVQPPAGCYIGKDGFPHSSPNLSEDIYSVYRTPTGMKYHKTPGCSNSWILTNVAAVPPYVTACAKCHPPIILKSDLAWYAEYLNHKKVVKKSKPYNFVDDLLDGTLACQTRLYKEVREEQEIAELKALIDG